MKLHENFITNKQDYEIKIEDILQFIDKFKLNIVPTLTKLEGAMDGSYKWDFSKYKDRKSGGVFRGVQSSSNLADVLHTTITSVSCALAPTYTASEEETEALNIFKEVYNATNGEELDVENADNVGIFGFTYEIIYLDEENHINMMSLDPREVFIITDNSLKKEKVAAIRFVSDSQERMTIELYGRTIYRRWVQGDKSFVLEEEKPNLIGKCNIIKIENNKFCKGDFAPVLPVIEDIVLTVTSSSDLLHYMTSPIMVSKGLKLEPADVKNLNDFGFISSIESDFEISFVCRPESTEQIKMHLDILLTTLFRDSFCPRLDSSGDISKVASGKTLQYLYIATSSAVSKKVAGLTKAIRERLDIVFAYINFTRRSELSYSSIYPTYTANLPTITSSQIEEIAQIAAMGILSQQTLLEILPNSVCSDVMQELERIKQEQSQYEINADDMITEEGDLDEED